MNRFLVLLIVLSLCFSILPSPTLGLRYGKTTSLANADASFWGDKDSDFSGASVAIVGDVNGDGLDDFIVGSTGFDAGATNNVGKIYLFFGKATGWTKDANLENSDASFLGEQSASSTGSVVAPAGDVNGDGYADFLIGAQTYDRNGDAAFEGKVYLILGKATGWARDTPMASSDASWVGYNGHEHVGTSVGGTGDVNGDGFDDILFGASSWNVTDGKVHVVFGKAGGWANNVVTNNTDVTVWGTGNISLGASVSDAGDLNNDGFDDIAIGAPNYPPSSMGAPSPGEVLIFLGKASGWKKNLTISDPDIVFDGIESNDQIGATVAGVHDVNGDGMDDLLIGSTQSDSNNNGGGLVILILGPISKGTPISPTANFYPTRDYQYLGAGLSTAGDVNGDGLTDFIVGARSYGPMSTGGGEAHLVLGNQTWNYNNNPPMDASFFGEVFQDQVSPVSGGGDINGDGYDDLLIGAPGNDEGPGNDAGQAYLVFPDANLPPTSITSVKLYSDDTFTTQTNIKNMNETVYVELVGTGGNATRRDIALVRVAGEKTNTVGFNLMLMETAVNTGKYRGDFTIKPWNDKDHRCINATAWENITVKSVKDPAKNAIVVLRGTLQMSATPSWNKAQEDVPYTATFTTTTAPSVSWLYSVAPAADWLSWGLNNHTLYGTPDNSNVPVRYQVTINATCMDVLAQMNFELAINNSPPSFSPTILPVAVQDQYYFVDFQSDDEGQGQTLWSLTTPVHWAKINATTGVFNGTPAFKEVGELNITVKVDDYNGAVNSSVLKLVVKNVNDRPNITTLDVTVAREDEYYFVKYMAEDKDLFFGDNLNWTMKTNAGAWLSLAPGSDNTSKFLRGTPGNNDTGKFWVNITVMDKSNAMDSHNFTLNVININDLPNITSTPEKKAFVNHSWKYQVVATDVDDTVLSYSLDKSPSGMAVNKTTGLVQWTPLVGQAGQNDVIVNVTDKAASVIQTFKITVSINRPPTIMSNPPADAVVGTKYEYTPVLQDLDTDPMTMKLDVFPTGMYINVSANKLEWLPAASQLGDQKVTINVTDGIDFTLQAFSVKVLLTRNHPPVILDTPAPAGAVKVGKKYYFRVSASDEDTGDSVTFSLDKGPAGMQIDHQSGVITWTPVKGDIGSHDISVSAGDGKGGLDILNWTITVQKAPAVKKDTMGMLLPFILIAVIIAVVLGIVGYVLVKKRAAAKKSIASIDDIFLMYQDGRLISHHTRKLRPDVDDQVLGGMLTAVQSFMKDSFHDGEDSNVNEISYGDKKILIEHGKYVFLATVIRGHGTSEMHETMKNAVLNIEREYEEVLKDWTGETSTMKDAKTWLKALIEEE
jgi:hypothetical protein